MDSLLLSAGDSAKLLGMSQKHFYNLYNVGKIPLPKPNLGRRNLWSVQELKDWIAADCPNRALWQQLKKGNKLTTD